jgi:hypothetical protein
MLADGGAAHVQALDQAGENLGVVFQLKDDELGIFGAAEQSGKRADSDVREDKKTLLRHFLFELADAGLRARLADVFGSRDPGEAGLRFVRAAMEETGARAKVREYMHCFAMEASDRIAALPPQAGARGSRAEAFRDLFRYSVETERLGGERHGATESPACAAAAAGASGPGRRRRHTPTAGPPRTAGAGAQGFRNPPNPPGRRGTHRAARCPLAEPSSEWPPVSGLIAPP